jgi:tripartite-type tricarboxylate transporter receptor subunit TctC
MRQAHVCVALALFGLAYGIANPARADSVEDFYRGKNVTMVIGYSVGGGYDLYGRLVARYLGRHIPGQPNIVPQNREGAGSMRAAIYIYNAAPKDGTVIGTFSRSMSVAPLLQEAPFDASKFSWLGSVSTDVNVCMTWHTSAVKTWDDMLTKPAKIGGLGAGADPDIFALMFKNVFGAKFQVVSGYPGTNDVALAMERGEVDGMCGLSWSTVKTRHGDWLANKKVNIPVQAGLHKENDIANVPLVMDLVKTPEQTQIVRLILASQEMARPFAAPPGIPDDRRRALIEAFDKTMKDPDFLAEAEKMKADVNPVSAAAIDALLTEVYKTPKDVVLKAAKATSNTQ